MTWRWIPNAICIVRIVLVIPIVAGLLRQDFTLALLLIVVAGFSDGLDGFLAKTFNWRTRLGGLLDPLADKLLMTATFVTLTYIGLVPFMVTVIVVARDAVIICGAIAYQFLVAPVRGHPSLVSKLNTACQLSFVVFIITHAGFDWPPDISLLVLGAAVVFLSVVSGLNYVLHWSRLAWQAKQSKDAVAAARS